LILAASLVVNVSVEAGAGDNVSGFAWSENIGWISFNNASGGGAINYGVNISPSTGIFSGYAWSDNIGWISFNSSDLTGCPSGTCQAQLDLQNGQVSGWARVLASGGGWEGWIKLAGDGLNWNSQQGRCTGNNNYDNDNQCNWGVKIDTGTGAFQGYAWSDMVAGWISFSGSNYGVIVSPSIFNQAPRVISPSVDSPNQTDYCGVTSYPAVRVRWQFQDPGDSQSAYQVQIDNNSNFSSPENDSGQVLSANLAYTPSNLSFGASYYWRVKVWDSKGQSSVWKDGSSFATISHAYPKPNFSWAPLSPNAGELIQFADQTTYYGGFVGQSWVWDFGDSQTSSVQNPTHSYLAPGTYQVLLGVCDNSGQCCNGANGKQNIIQTFSPLPDWKEVAPF